MNSSIQPRTLTLGLFEKRIEGDDCLMELARLRFQQAGMGAEMHAGTPEQLAGLLRYRPSEEAPVVVHLPRDFHLADPRSQGRVLDLASRFAHGCDIVLPEASHFIAMEEPDLVADEIRKLSAVIFDRTVATGESVRP